MLSVVVDLNLGFLDSLPDRLEAALRDDINLTLLAMQVVARVAAPVDTGFLRDQIFVVDTKGSVVGMGKGGALDASAIPKVSGLEGWLVAGAEYSIYVEYGHFARAGDNRSLEALDMSVVDGRVAVNNDGSLVTFVPGYFFMASAMEYGREFLSNRARQSVRRVLGQ